MGDQFHQAAGETMFRALILVAVVLSAGSWVTPTAAEDRHAGYYYPEPVTHETYIARAQTLPGASRNTRLAFVTGVVAQQGELPYPAQTAMFAKGVDAQKLIIVGLEENRMNTIYRARAVLAMLTAVARTTEIFQQFQVESEFTFLDLCKMLGFDQLTISDGKTFSHQFAIQ
jgi:hypothetical protein